MIFQFYQTMGETLMNAIGITPSIKPERLLQPGCAGVYVKYGGAERRGQLKPGSDDADC
jgi:hypothetical protein